MVAVLTKWLVIDWFSGIGRLYVQKAVLTNPFNSIDASYTVE